MGCEPTLGGPLLFPLSFPLLTLTHYHPPISHLTLPFLRKSPLNVGKRCKLPIGVWGGAPAEIEFGVKILP